MDGTPVAEGISALSRFLVGERSVQQTLERVAQLTVEAIAPADLVGITLVVEGTDRTVVYTDEASPRIDQAQYDADEGPCLEALRRARVVTVTSTRAPGPWPEFRRAAVEHGVLSTLSLPLVVDDRPLGAMNLYAHQEAAFHPGDRVTGELFASQAAVVLANAQAYWDAHELSVGLGEAMKNRAVIEQAKGILMSRQGCDEEAAFQLLVHASQRENVKLRAIAQRIVEDAVRAAEQDGR